MLERICEIQGIGLLHDSNGKPYKLQKATLIYADNRRGKSTLASILRSVATADSSFISTRKTVDGRHSPKVILQFSNGHSVSFNNNTWTEQRPEIILFDSDFIERNVHSGGTVSTNHRKNLLEFALGESAVTARLEVEKAMESSRLATEKVKTLQTQLSGRHHVGITLSHFEKLPPIEDIDSKIDELQRRISAARNITDILEKAVPTSIPLPIFDIEEFFEMLSTSLEDVHLDAERLVKQHVEILGNRSAENWLSQGQQFDNREACPYCGQDKSGIDLIKAYRTYFNATYKNLILEVDLKNLTALRCITSGNIESFAQRVSTVAAQISGWADQVKTNPINFDAEIARAAMSKLYMLVLDLSQKKQTSPADAWGSKSEMEQATNLWNEIIASMQVVNLAISNAVTQINTYKDQLTSDNIQQLEQQLNLHISTKHRYNLNVIKLIADLDLARTELKEAENLKKTARDNLDSFMKNTLTQYEKGINDLLKKFGASFEIKGMDANYRGTSPRSEYGLLLRGKEVVLEGSSPSFGTALSEGDKRTLAFAFFVASTLADAKLSKRIVIIDDPMCSLDLNRKHYTKTILRKIHSKAEQLIVLAHDPYFLRDFRDTLLKENNSAHYALMQLTLAPNEYTNFATFDVDKECESAYFQHHRMLNDFVSGFAVDSRAVAKAIRPMLEGYLHRRFPGIVPKALLFGQVVNLIREARPPNPLCHAQGLVEQLNEINDYAGQFHHDTNPSADSIKVVSSELRTYVEHSLKLVYGGA